MSKTKAKRKNKRWTEAEDEQLMSQWGEVRRGDNAQRRRIAKGLGRTEASCGQRFNTLKRQGKPTQQKNYDLTQQKNYDPTQQKDYDSVLEFFESHKRTLAKEKEQRLVIQDTIDKMEVLLGRLRKVLE